MICPPVMICGFNRPECLQLVFNAVRKARPSELFLVLDAPRVGRPSDVEGVLKCKAVFDGVDWPCNVHHDYATVNMGCGPRMISGINHVFEHVDRAIILEDDCVPSGDFFVFCEELLERYKDDSRVGMIAGHDEHLHLAKMDFHGDSYYFDRMASIWGWATWRRAWKKFDPEIKEWPFMAETRIHENIFKRKRYVDHWIRTTRGFYDGSRKTWAGRWAFTVYRENWLCIHPTVNLIANVGDCSSRIECNGRWGVKKTVSDIWINRPYGRLELPLIHPRTMIPNTFCESYYMEDVQHCISAWMRIASFPGRVIRKIRRVCESLLA